MGANAARQWTPGRILNETHELPGVAIVIKAAMGGWVVIVPSEEDRLGPFASVEEAKQAAVEHCT
jgi:hypothetical protein